MTDRQWEKVRLRIQQLMNEKKGLVQFVLIERLDGTIQLQVIGGTSEIITRY